MGYLDQTGLSYLWEKITGRSDILKILTKAEYDALSEEEKNREDAIYYVPGASDSSSGGASVGSGIPPGGSTDQVLSKASNEDGDVEWGDPGVTMEEVDTAISAALSNTVTTEQVNAAISAALIGRLSVEESDTSDGWHVRKYSDGYIEMSRVVLTDETSITRSFGSAFITQSYWNYSYPVSLTKKYNEQISMDGSGAQIIFPVLGTLSSLSATPAIYAGSFTSRTSIRATINILVTGRWK